MYLSSARAAYLDLAPGAWSRAGSNARLKMVIVNPGRCDGKVGLHLEQDAHYPEMLTASGFDGLPRHMATVWEAYRLGVMPTKPYQYGADTADDLIARAEVNLVDFDSRRVIAGTGGNEAPLHLNAISYSASAFEGIRGRDQQKGYFYCLGDAGSGPVFRELNFRIPSDAGLIDPRGGKQFHALVSGKPIVWDGERTSMSQYLPPMLSDLRHVFDLPVGQGPLDGLPLGRRELQGMIEQDRFAEIEEMILGRRPLVLDFEQELIAAQELGIKPEPWHLSSALSTFRGARLNTSTHQASIPLQFGSYRHTFWAQLKGGEIMLGYVSAPSNREAVTFPELQELLLSFGAEYALALCGGRDTRLYREGLPMVEREYLAGGEIIHKDRETPFGIIKHIDADAVKRETIPSGVLLLTETT